MPSSESFEKTVEFDVSDSAWPQLAEKLQLFTQAWDKAPPIPNISEFIAHQSGLLRSVALIEMIKIDMEYRSRTSDAWQPLEQYKAEWGEICHQDNLPTDLIYEEYQIRRQMPGENTDLDDYQKRFPLGFESLTRLIADGANKTTRMIDAVKTPSFEPGDRIDDFDLLTRLGQGAFATVFLARQNSMQRLVALKISADQGHEPQTLGQLDHPHIVRVFDQRVIDAPRVRLMYMQYVAGGTMHEVFWQARQLGSPNQLHGKHLVSAVDHLLRMRGESIPTESENRRRLSRARWPIVVSHIGCQIASALGYAHDRHVLHRDLKPANILIDANCDVKIVDFNISFCSKLDGATPAAYFGGSLAYMSPEQLEACSPQYDRRPDDLDGRSDIYSVGVLLYELLVGQRPFSDRDSDGSWKNMIAEMIHERRTGISTEADAKLEPYSTVLVETIRRCLRGDEDQRFQSNVSLRRQLEWAKNSDSEQWLGERKHWLSKLALRFPFQSTGAITMGISVSVIAFIIAYNLDNSVEIDEPDSLDFYNMLIGRINLFMFALAAGLIFIIVRPVSAVLAKLRSGLQPANAELAAATKRNLFAGYYVGLMSALLWSIGGTLYPTFLSGFGYSLKPGGWFDFISSHTLTGLIVGLYVFWVVTFTALQVWHPRLLKAGFGNDEFIDWSRQHEFLEKLCGFNLVGAIAVPIVAISWLVLIEDAQDKLALSVISIVSLVGLFVLVWTSKRVQHWVTVLRSLDRDWQER